LRFFDGQPTGSISAKVLTNVTTTASGMIPSANDSIPEPILLPEELLNSYSSIDVLLSNNLSDAPATENQDGGGLTTTRCPEYNMTEPMLFPPVPDRSLIDDLQSSLGNSTYERMFSSCSSTCQVQLIPNCPYWELQTFDEHGNPKKVGGDEFYITFTDERRYKNQKHSLNAFHTQPFTAAAWITDLQNGCYRLDFQAAPFTASFGDQVDRGVLAVYFQYTCKIGFMGPVAKQGWKHGGNTVALYKSDVLPIAPPIRAFESPIDATRPQFEDFETLIPLGDSLLQQFLGPLGIEFPNIWKALHMDNVGLWKKELDKEIGKRSKGHLVQETTAIITDSCVWDILEDLNMTSSTLDGSPEWPVHRLALEEFLSHIHQTLPNLTVFWKSCTGMHIHIPILLASPTNKNWDWLQSRVKCLSTHRAWGLYSIQKDIIQKEISRQEEEARLPAQHIQRLFFLDVYPAYYLSAYRSRPNDGRHYTNEMNGLAVTWFGNKTLLKNSNKQ
jgi:hypothetical protein